MSLVSLSFYFALSALLGIKDTPSWAVSPGYYISRLLALKGSRGSSTLHAAAGDAFD
jgi:hypothetical protein